jgi:hypothetical protein
MTNLKEVYAIQELRWRVEIARLHERLASAEARLEYYQRRIAAIKYGPRVLEAAQ